MQISLVNLIEINQIQSLDNFKIKVDFKFANRESLTKNSSDPSQNLNYFLF